MDEMKHRLEMWERRTLRVDGVRHVESFTDEMIAIDTSMGFLVLSGEGLHITQLNLDEGTMTIDGFVNGLKYRESGPKPGRRGKNLLGRLLK